METSGIILIDKREGISSVHEEVAFKRLLNIRKTGHAGTLDPFASGLLLLGVNNGTKVLNLFEGKSKTYQAVISLGAKTDTADLQGKVIKTQETHTHSLEEIQAVLSSFKGETKQIPPMYSALKKDGVRLYKLAREGIEVERKPRTINISEIKLLGYDEEGKTISFEVNVSKGTYIRTLGEDIAEKLGELGHLSKLRRTRIGGFSIPQAVKTEEASLNDIISIRDLFKGIRQKTVDAATEKRIRNGADVLFPDETADIILCNSPDESLALYTKKDGSWYHVLKEFTCENTDL